MLDRRFKEAEVTFAQLRKQFLRGEISRDQFAESLKKLRLFDDQGKCWMIGVQSGKWYYYDGQTWRQSEPPVDRQELILCPECQHYNEPGVRVCESCGAILTETVTKIACPVCGNLIDPTLKTCPYCQTQVISERTFTQKGEKAEVLGTEKRGEETEFSFLKAADHFSFFFFFGGLGIIIGVLFGLILGATEFFPNFVSLLPASLKEMQGKLVGGLVFSLLGGIFGFILAALSGLVLAILINASIYFFGGPGFRLEKSKRKIFPK